MKTDHESNQKHIITLYKTKLNNFIGTSKELKKIENERDYKLKKINEKIIIQQLMICEVPIETVTIVSRMNHNSQFQDYQDQ